MGSKPESDADSAAGSGLLCAHEPPAFEVVRPQGASPYFLLCDHASARMPERLGDLGLDAAALASHIAYDLGIREASLALAARLDATLVMSGYSRLAIDCNRPLVSASSIPEITCGVRVPGNLGLDQPARVARQTELFWPYHHAVSAALAARGTRPTAILSMHSFTPELGGERRRPWQIGIMYGRDRRLAGMLLEDLSQSGLVIGDNQPYQVGRETDYGIPVYAEAAGRPGVLIELRQDCLADPVETERLVKALERALLARQDELFSAAKAE